MAKTVLITGANRGIGQQVARVLATQGWYVLVGARDRKKGDAAAKRLREDTGGRLRAVELDVTRDESVAAAARTLRDGAIKLDALVNNAGIYGSAGPAETLETNFFGALRTTEAMRPLLVDGGSITNVTSSLGSAANLDAGPRAALLAITERDVLAKHVRGLARAQGRGWGTEAYGASKASLDQLTRILARELAPRAIRVNATDPGWVRTDMGGRGAPRTIEQGGASVLFGVTTDRTGGIWRDGKPIR